MFSNYRDISFFFYSLSLLNLFQIRDSKNEKTDKPDN